MSNISHEDQRFIDDMARRGRKMLDEYSERQAQAGAERLESGPDEEGEATPEQLAAADAEMKALFGATDDNPHFRAVAGRSAPAGATLEQLAETEARRLFGATPDDAHFMAVFGMSDEDRLLMSLGGPGALADAEDLSRVVLLNATGAPPTLPTELLQFPFGEIPTVKGTLRFTRRSAKLITEKWATLGRDIGFDYEHDAWTDRPGYQKQAAGWGRVELRPDGLWIVGITWTPEAAAAIRSGAFRYISQALERDDSGEIIGLRNVALTNNPATLRARPII